MCGGFILTNKIPNCKGIHMGFIPSVQGRKKLEIGKDTLCTGKIFQESREIVAVVLEEDTPQSD
jgi:hypothetical protein